jgi:hypothetical protein
VRKWVRKAGRGVGEVVFDRRKPAIVGRRCGNVKDRADAETALLPR